MEGVPGSWLPAGTPCPRPSHRSLVRAGFRVSWPRPPLYPPRATPLPSPFPSPPPPAWSVVRGEGACVSRFGSGPGNFLRRLGLGQRDAPPLKKKTKTWGGGGEKDSAQETQGSFYVLTTFIKISSQKLLIRVFLGLKSHLRK